MFSRSRRLALVIAFGASVAALPAAGARADSLVYMNGGNVWIAHGDGSQARQVTGAPNTWSWPAEDDAGHILVAGGQGGVRAGVEDSPGSEIHRLDQHGQSLSAPQQTPGSMSTVGCIAYPPQGLRVAPDGVHYAYHAFVCDRFETLIGTVGGQGFTTEDMPDFRFPYWVDDSDFVVSRGGMPLLDSDGEWWVHDLGDQPGYGFNWFGDPDTYAEPGNPDGWATGFDGIAVSRDGTKVATLEEDAGNWTSGAAHRVAIRLWSAAGAPTPARPSVTAPAFRCQLELPPDPGVTAWYYDAGPTFSPDGTRLAFAEPDGIHIADVSNLDDCAAITAPLVIPGGTQPSWSAADEAPDAGWTPPAGGGGGAGSGGGGGAPGGGGAGGGHGSGGAPDRTAPKLGAFRIRPRRFAVAKSRKPRARARRAATARYVRSALAGARARASVRYARPARARARRGATVRYTLSEPARVTFTVRRATAGRRKGHRCVKPTRRLRHARRCTRWRSRGVLRRSGQSGANQLRFSGRIGRRRLSPGRYRLAARARDAAGNRGRTRTVSFRIVRR